MLCDIRLFDLEGAIENSPAIHRWVRRPVKSKSRKGRLIALPNSFSAVPCGTRQSRSLFPAINRRAIAGRPFGTDRKNSYLQQSEP